MMRSGWWLVGAMLGVAAASLGVGWAAARASRESVPSAGPLVALAAATGKPLSGFPQVNPGGAVLALADDGRGGWYVGGEFRSVGGVVCPNLAHIRGDRRVESGWCPRPDGRVGALVRVGGHLYVGGDSFTRIAGQQRISLAAFDTAGGGLLSWNPLLRPSWSQVRQLGLSPDGSQLYVSGLFDRIGEATRHNFASVNTTTGRATTFAPNPDANSHGDCVSTFAATRTRVYAWGDYSHIGGKPASRTSGDALDPRTGRLLTHHPSTDGGPYNTVVVGNIVYLGGGFHILNGTARNALGAIVASTAAATSWKPLTRPHQDIEQLAQWNHSIIAALVADNRAPGTRHLAAYDQTSGRLVWRSPTISLGYVSTLATDATTILIGGST